MRHRWTKKDIAFLRANRMQDVEWLAERLGVSVHAVWNKTSQLGLAVGKYERKRRCKEYLKANPNADISDTADLFGVSERRIIEYIREN